MKTIKGSKEFLKDVTKVTSEIDKSIIELSKELEHLEASLKSREEKYTLEEIKKIQSLQKDIDILKDTILSLENRKLELIENNSQDVSARAHSLLMLDRERKRELHLKDRQKITQLRKEADLLNQEMLENDKEYARQEREFIKELQPYLSTERRNESHRDNSSDQYILKEKLGISGVSRHEVLNPYRQYHNSEADYSIE